jgi:hypothetical protein
MVVGRDEVTFPINDILKLNNSASLVTETQLLKKRFIVKLVTIFGNG